MILPDLKKLKELVTIIKNETRPIEGHSDPNTLTDVWNSIDEILMTPEDVETPDTVDFYPNGNVVVFKGIDQVGELQINVYCMYFEFLERNGIDPREVIFYCFGNTGIRQEFKPFYVADEGFGPEEWNLEFLKT